MIILRPARRRDAGRIVALAEAEFGEGYTSKKEVLAEIDDHIVLFVGDKLAGFASIAQYEPYDGMEKDEALAYVDSVAVNSNHRRQGFGTMLVAACVATLSLRGADLIECVAQIMSTQDDARPPLAGSLERNEFYSVQYLSHYWKDDENPTYTCRNCNSTDCRCDAMLYRRRLNT